MEDRQVYHDSRCFKYQSTSFPSESIFLQFETCIVSLYHSPYGDPAKLHATQHWKVSDLKQTLSTSNKQKLTNNEVTNI